MLTRGYGVGGQSLARAEQARGAAGVLLENLNGATIRGLGAHKFERYFVLFQCVAGDIISPEAGAKNPAGAGVRNIPDRGAFGGNKFIARSHSAAGGVSIWQMENSSCGIVNTLTVVCAGPRTQCERTVAQGEIYQVGVHPGNSIFPINTAGSLIASGVRCARGAVFFVCEGWYCGGEDKPAGERCSTE